MMTNAPILHSINIIINIIANMTIPINTMMVTIPMIKTPKPIKSGQTYWPLPRPNCPIATVSLNHKLYVEA